MNFKDSHVHIGNYETVSFILKNTKYLEKYKLYKAINIENIKNQEIYLKSLSDFFAIPIIFKEISIQQENKFVTTFCENFGKGVPVTLIDNNQNFEENFKYAIFKEHFLLHNFENYQNRSLYYEYLSENNGYLILHSKDDIRVEYIKKLRTNFPNMNIIVAHLGRKVFENFADIYNILNEFRYDNHIYFDFSTINDIKNIMLALEIIDYNRILYGSDFPYDFDYQQENNRKKSIELKLENKKDIFNVIGGTNFERIKSLSKIKK